jgi:zinc protease
MMPKLLRSMIFATVFSLCCIPAPAQDRIPLPDSTSKRLLNDLQVAVVPTPNLGDGMTIGLGIRYGAAFDPAGKEGLANLVSRMFMRATVDLTYQDIQDELTYLGASVEIKCDWDGIRLLIKGDSSTCERSLLLLYRAVGEAQFDEAGFTAVKKSILENLQKVPDPRQRIHGQLKEVLFSGTNHGRPFEGTSASLSAISLGDVRFFYRRYFSPAQASLQIVGNVSPKDVLQKVARIWGVWVRNEDIPFTFAQPRKPAGRQIFVEDDPSSPAAQFIVGGFFPAREDAAYISSLLAAQILQERLTQLLPTSLLTVGSEGRRMASTFYVQGQAAAEQTVEQIQKIQAAIDEMKRTLVSKEELDTARKALIDEHARRLSSTDGLCNFMLDTELYRLGSNYASLVLDQIQRSSPEMIKQTANDWIFPGGEVLLIRGPLFTLKPLLSPLGAFQQLSVRD